MRCAARGPGGASAGRGRADPPAGDGFALRPRQGIRGGGAGRGLPARAGRGGRGLQGHQVRSAASLGPLFGRVRRRRVVAVPRTAVRREAGLPAGVQDVEPSRLRCRGVDAPVQGQRPASLRVHDQAPRRLLDVRDAHPRPEARGLDGHRRSPARGLRAGLQHRGDAVRARRRWGALRRCAPARRQDRPLLLAPRLGRAPRSARSSTAARPLPSGPATSSSSPPSPRPRRRPG